MTILMSQGFDLFDEIPSLYPPKESDLCDVMIAVTTSLTNVIIGCQLPKGHSGLHEIPEFPLLGDPYRIERIQWTNEASISE